MVQDRLVAWLERDSDFPVQLDATPPETREELYQRLKRECPEGWEVVLEADGTIVPRRL